MIDAAGGYYYRDHLPILGQPPPLESIRRAAAVAAATALPTAGTSAAATCVYNVDDKVKVIVTDEDELKMLQEGHGK